MIDEYEKRHFQREGISKLRQMRQAIKNENKGIFDRAFSGYKAAERGHFTLSGQMFPGRIDRIYGNIMINEYQNSPFLEMDKRNF